ncbi:VOC family protein [Qipengyuania sp. XHP0211]|uniref:VOC family protein n=1 Tax=Qipengyuania sp. XHP0211 TaxID=3038079 RepID=UPI00241CD327|nr:VOC family protein [Qipengyuania sp. XHP0211]MDG5751828.1 VOC family protein [Qipengyuania sp. XHP0211]
MIGYVTLGSQDLERSAKFYDPIAAEMGVGRMMEFPTFIAWGDANGAPGIAATKPYDGNAPSVGNGVMVALECKDRDQVKRLHELALSNGGSDEGEPGPRGEPDANGMVFYAAYFRDPDGNKLNAFLMDKAE